VIRIIIAEDHHLVRQGIRALLEKQAHISVIAEAQDGQEAFDLTRKMRPDVLLLDINMPLINGIEVIKRIRSIGLQTEVLILSMHEDESMVKRAFWNGARGYILKKSITEELFTAINETSTRRTYLSPQLNKVLDFNDLETSMDVRQADQIDRLTTRELEVCQLIAGGNTNNEIAHQLGISVKTVEKHRANLMEKLNVQDVAGLIREAIKHGVIFLEG
jgi:two-component system, NarL family, response regulator NreC